MQSEGNREPTVPIPDSAGRPAVLTKTDLVDEVCRGTELRRWEAKVVVDSILDSMVRAIDRGDKVEIRGFGSFGTRPRKARVGRNPKTGARVEVSAKRIPFFKPSQELRNLIQKI